jgi:hypothetical protein
MTTWLCSQPRHIVYAMTYIITQSQLYSHGYHSKINQLINLKKSPPMTMYSYGHVQCHVLFFTLVMEDTSIQFNYVIWKAMSLIRFEPLIPLVPTQNLNHPTTNFNGHDNNCDQKVINMIIFSFISYAIIIWTYFIMSIYNSIIS